VADKQIKDLTAAASFSATDRVAIDNASNASRKVTGQQIKDFVLGGALSLNRTNTVIDYTVLVTDFYIAVTNTDATRTITIDSDNVAAGRMIVIADESGGAGVNSIIIATEGAETISGEATYPINVDYNVVWLISDGTNWFIIGGGIVCLTYKLGTLTKQLNALVIYGTLARTVMMVTMAKQQKTLSSPLDTL